MKRMLKVLPVVLFALALSLLPGCGGKEEAATLTIWQTYNDEEYPVFKEIVDSFQATHPGVTIEVVRLPFAGAEPNPLEVCVALRRVKR